MQAIYRIPQYPKNIATYANAQIMGLIHDNENGFNTLAACRSFEWSLQKEENNTEPSEYLFIARAVKMVAGDIYS